MYLETFDIKNISHIGQLQLFRIFELEALESHHTSEWHFIKSRPAIPTTCVCGLQMEKMSYRIEKQLFLPSSLQVKDIECFLLRNIQQEVSHHIVDISFNQVKEEYINNKYMVTVFIDDIIIVKKEKDVPCYGVSFYNGHIIAH